jgi:hypothetical protein
MSEDSPRTMYASPDRKRFFHIPDDARLPAGSFVVRSLKGAKLEVDESSLTPFELDEAAAKAIVKAEVARVAKSTQQFLAGAAAALRSARPMQPGDGEGASPTFAGILGMTPDQVRSNPQEAMEAFKQTLRSFAETVRDAAQPATNPEAVSAKDRVRAMSQFLEAQGSEFAGTVEQLPERLHKFLANPELEQQLRKVSQDLRSAAAELRGESPSPDGNPPKA